MKIYLSHFSFFLLLLGLIISTFSFASDSDINLSLKLNGVENCKISVYSIAESKNNLVKEFPAVQNGESVIVDIPAKYLPGEFVLLFEYSDNAVSTRPENAERMIIINSNNIEFVANPKYINHPDSSYFNAGELENTVLAEFAMQTMSSMEMLDVIQTFLLKYDDQSSELYKAGISEFNKRKDEHNSWIDTQLVKHKELFCSNMFYFYYVPDVNWTGSPYERQKSLISNYFVGMDFSNKNVLRVSYLKSWMDSYVNKYIELATSQEMMTQLFVEAGEKAIDKSKNGDPYFYGWMVDYFFNGYETMNIQEGITMLQKYVSDPNCMTYKKKEIDKRVTGIQTLKEGVVAPNFSFVDDSGENHDLHSYHTNADYKLVVFWSADCEHCEALVNSLYEWNELNKSELEVFALSLDESNTEVPKWEVRRHELPIWNHILTIGGINSKEAEAYYILSTPTMFLIDSKTNKIISSPMSIDELLEDIK